MCIVFIFHRPLHKLEGLIFKMIFVMWPNSAEVKVQEFIYLFFFWISFHYFLTRYQWEFWTVDVVWCYELGRLNFSKKPALLTFCIQKVYGWTADAIDEILLKKVFNNNFSIFRAPKIVNLRTLSKFHEKL